MLPYGRCEIIIGSSEQQHPTLQSDFKCFALDISTGSSMDAPCRYGYPVGQVADLVLCCHPQEKSKATVMECILCILLARSLGTDCSITAVLRGKIHHCESGRHKCVHGDTSARLCSCAPTGVHTACYIGYCINSSFKFSNQVYPDYAALDQ